MKGGGMRKICPYQYYSAAGVTQVIAPIRAQGQALVLQRVCCEGLEKVPDK